MHAVAKFNWRVQRVERMTISEELVDIGIAELDEVLSRVLLLS